MDLKPLKVQAEIMWAFLDQPNQLSGKYQVDLCNLTKGAVDTLKSMGVNVMNKENQPEKGQYITAKSVNYPIKTEDSNGNPINGKVGNGSKGIALLKPYEYSYKGKKGIGVGINKLVVTDLVVYEGADSTETADDVL